MYERHDRRRTSFRISKEAFSPLGMIVYLSWGNSDAVLSIKKLLHAAQVR